MIAAGAETAFYVYGVVPSDASVPYGIERVASGGVAAIVGRVGLDEFGEESLRRNLEDRRWLEEVARGHDRVLASVVGTPLVPFRFGTVYRDQDAVCEMLRLREAELRDALERVRGRVELGVKAFLVEAPTGQQAPASGRDYLRQKQLARDARTEAIDAVRTLHEHLASLADDARVNRPQPAELSGRAEPMLLNAAYLVREEQQPEFGAAAADHGDGNVEVVVTGPWPAYNFVEQDAA